MTKPLILFFILYIHTSPAGEKLIRILDTKIPAKITYKTFDAPDDKDKKYYQVESIDYQDSDIDKIMSHCKKHLTQKYMKDPENYWVLLNDNSEDFLFALFCFLYKKIILKK